MIDGLIGVPLMALSEELVARLTHIAVDWLEFTLPQAFRLA